MISLLAKVRSIAMNSSLAPVVDLSSGSFSVSSAYTVT